ncbi:MULTISPECIES: hypothetical protein [Sinorhizobium]|uniref:hypothetical protein n=1 Tax=Sinorhizobium sp. NG07B TaxID=1538174 RepID=UPI001F176E38|nr:MULTISPECIES: hypothetical protein [Sinorhizobium]
MHGSRDTDVARFVEGLQPRRYIDPVSEEITAAGDYVAKIDADAEHHAAAFGEIDIAAAEGALNSDGATQRLHGTCELNHDAIASHVEHPTAVFGDKTRNNLLILSK